MRLSSTLPTATTLRSRGPEMKAFLLHRPRIAIRLVRKGRAGMVGASLRHRWVEPIHHNRVDAPLRRDPAGAAGQAGRLEVPPFRTFLAPSSNEQGQLA